MKSRRKNTI